MGYKLAAIGLAPVIIAQGLYVRRVTPRLPEPEGERSGVNGAGPPLSLLILGDSAAAGVGVATQDQALSGQLASALGSDFRVSWKLVAQTGHTAKSVAAMLKTAAPEAYHAVVTSIGVNDVTHGTNTQNWIREYRQIIELLETKFQAQYILLSGLPPMHLFPALPQPLRWYIGKRASKLDNELMHLAESCKRCALVKTNFPLKDEYMAADGFHPGAAAYTIWADQIADILRTELAKPILL